MTKNEIIDKAKTYVGDTSDLPESEFSDLFDKIYQRVCADRPWEFTKTTATLTQSTSVPYVALPDDFLYPVSNYNYAGNDWYAQGAYLLIGTDNTPYQILPFSDRNRYVNATNKAYIDVRNNRITFTLQPTAANTFSFDYHASVGSIDGGESPLFPATYHPVIYHGMVADDFLIQLFDKAKSYRDENLAEYRRYMTDLASWNFRMAPQM